MKATIFLTDTPDGAMKGEIFFFGAAGQPEAEHPDSHAHRIGKLLMEHIDTLGERLTEPATRIITAESGLEDHAIANQGPLLFVPKGDASLN